MVGKWLCLVGLTTAFVNPANAWVNSKSLFHTGTPLMNNTQQEFVASFIVPSKAKSLKELETLVQRSDMLWGAKKIILSKSTKDGQFEHLVLFDNSDKSADATLEEMEAALASESETDVKWVYPNFEFVGDPREDDTVDPPVDPVVDPVVDPTDPNDILFAKQEHHIAMDNKRSWEVGEPSAEIVVAVTDDGGDINHEDLKANIYINPNEIPDNGIDDDQNGFIDDVHGWDFNNEDNDPSPRNSFESHGTHVAGIVAAVGNNNVGLIGTAPHAKVMPLKFYGGKLPWNAARVAESYDYAVKNGAKIITTSFNIDRFVGNPIYKTAIDMVYENEVLLFNSAGNAGRQDPKRVVFEEVILVASTESRGSKVDQKSGFSNYGVGIDIAAPGSDIYSTVPSNKYDRKSGTSMAAPNAAAVAAAIWGHNPEWNRDQVAAQLFGTADNIDAVNAQYLGKLGTGRVNTYKAVAGEARPSSLALGEASTSEEGAQLEVTLTLTGVFSTDSILEAANYTATYAGEDGEFGTRDDAILAVELPESYRIATNELLLNLGDSRPGKYKLEVSGLKDPFARDFDGDLDGAVGGNFSAEFSL